MKTQVEKMQHVTEAADECWHDVQEHVGETMGHYFFECSKCGINDRYNGTYPTNPSPSDLNELFRLAEKLQMYVQLEGEDLYRCFLICEDQNSITSGQTKTPSEALLNSLFIATGGKE